MLTKVKRHLRKSKNKVSVVVRHYRNVEGQKWKNPKSGRMVGYSRAVQLGLVKSDGKKATVKSTGTPKSNPNNPFSQEEKFGKQVKDIEPINDFAGYKSNYIESNKGTTTSPVQGNLSARGKAIRENREKFFKGTHSLTGEAYSKDYADFKKDAMKKLQGAKTEKDKAKVLKKSPYSATTANMREVKATPLAKRTTGNTVSFESDVLNKDAKGVYKWVGRKKVYIK